jgi:hypothetical protein
MSTATKKGSELVEGALALVAAGTVAAVGFLLHRRKAVVSIADTPVTARLQKKAATLGGDPEYKQWAATTREAAIRGLLSDERIGKDELLRRKAALRKS